MIPNPITDRIERNDRGVSPVIGVILMVAITVILAAVIGTFVLDLGQSAGNSAPSASLTVSADADANTFSVQHKGGDSLQSSQTQIQVTNVTSEETITWSAAGSTTYGVGETAKIDVTTTKNVQIGGTEVWGSGDASGSFTGDKLESGMQYDVQVIDTESQRVIFETTVTA